MVNHHIKAGKHYPGWDINLPWIGNQSMQRYVRFSENCKYDSAPYNSQDVNKLFGMSFGLPLQQVQHRDYSLSPDMEGPLMPSTWQSSVHWNSARFGWRWSNSDQCIELLAYCYVNGKRNWDEQLRFPVVAQVQPGQVLDLSLMWHKDDGWFTFLAITPDKQEHWEEAQSVLRLPSYGLTHGLYFGGELPAPHQMDVQISRHPL